MSEIKFEEALKRLEDVVEGLESGDLPLEDSLAKYEEGVRLIRVCQKKLEQAKKKIEILVKTKDGKVRLEPFEEETAKKKSAFRQAQSRAE
ncbi:MAG: exodeoxyribonuclease VII small subunit [Omnitrophica bacterium RBG_13_46_9]|nr:MAG: exodeoxyribonuclease VII small subunit [Omnitrophica bacterium RBG_13_46_9]